ncbi:PilZ domain protein [Variibacter gotjawalensis]|jgi:hypothetical protein|uniref:PilZ domain protein n=1 Tax=Variibacter gotjawalensis TaxID=1333996 RepID=A0A0S3PW81_9BRAD|nr:PilZ domain-containing protein [Variibacter gotjawalensis]NIK45982.1 hypothetical protein [Variibacter gotjawalensis]RZS47900.1 PilZ domain-containing protein [Variibacter gotjawalensis]BAT60156.1 PilZ domain protein [Variibacter gotjawalensis]
MTIGTNTVSATPSPEERRRFARVRVNLLGRYMLANRQEYPCQVVDMSPGGMALVCPVAGRAGERVVAYIDHVGRVEGSIMRIQPTGFAMTIQATSRKRDKLAAQLTWLANRHLLDSPEDRRHDRQAPGKSQSEIVMPNGLRVRCDIIDVSFSGAAIGTTARPPIGSLITLGKIQSRVVRHRDDGIAIEFTRLQHPDSLMDNITP